MVSKPKAAYRKKANTPSLKAQLLMMQRVLEGYWEGDFSVQMPEPRTGPLVEIAPLLNQIIRRNDEITREIKQVSTIVKEEGRLSARAVNDGLTGAWAGTIDGLNSVIGQLARPTSEVSRVIRAVAAGDLSQKVSIEAKGEILEVKETINTMVDQLRSFSSEVTRVAKEVGTEGRLGGQADVKGVSGTWKDLTDNVNAMASNLTVQLRDVSKVATAIANGDLEQKITVNVKGEILELKNTINTMVDQLKAFASEVTRMAREVGTEGKLGGQAEVKGVSGTWRDLTENVNMLAGNLTNQVRNIAQVATAVANGDLSKKITVEARGEILGLKETINKMVDQLRAFASEVTRVAREVGTEGNLGAQAEVMGVGGTWKDLTDQVNALAGNLTNQVRNIALVTTAVANGDLSKKITVEAKGEILELKDTINYMTDTLRVFADQVTTVAREVGIEGKLGGQAKVPGASGTWRDLTDNVNQLAGNLTTQVRAIADVATAVTKGDLTRSITVQAQGEVLQLKDNINQMILNLKETTRANKEQDWLKTNLAKFTRMLQGQRSIEALSKLIMSELTPVVSAQYGAMYVAEAEHESPVLQLISSYAYTKRKTVSNRFSLGEGIVGQAALEKKPILITDVPENHVQVVTGLGHSSPRNLGVFPILFEGQLKAVLELASFQDFSQVHLSFLEQLMQSIGVVFNMIGASARTEELLRELQRSNAQLEGRSKELEDKARQLEVKNREIAKASASLEEKAKELSQISKYKSDFLANMSHELRTPLNSLLILAKMLSSNEEGTLTPKQVEFARTIHSSGNDLLSLIDEILDLSKIEAGKMRVDIRDVALSEVTEMVSRNFEQLARQKGLAFQTEIKPGAPASLATDPLRLNQVLKNLLSNSFKFTEKGSVRLSIFLAGHEGPFTNSRLNQAQNIIAFQVADTGVGIPKEKQDLIFEAFQQADTTTARKYGGTGLGLTISRELTRLLGGEIRLKSQIGEGSVFTLFLPAETPHEHQARIVEVPFPAQNFSQHTHLTTRQLTESLSGKDVLLIDDDLRSQYAIGQLLESRQIRVTRAGSAKEGIALLSSKTTGFDLIVIDLVMPGTNGFEAATLIRKIPAWKNTPIVAVSGKTMPGDREKCLEAGFTDFVSNPGEGEHLLTVIGQALVGSQHPSGSSTDSPALQMDPRVLHHKKILLVDDDPRNLFALTSYLEKRGATVTAFDNAKDAISALEKNADFDAILMDVMMPEMDGYEATREIRKIEKFKDIPIFAVTAKAMPEDGTKAMEAGYTGFIPKPVRDEQLLSILQTYILPSKKNKTLGRNSIS